MKKASISLCSGAYVSVQAFDAIVEESFGIVFIDADGKEVAIVNPGHLVYMSISKQGEE